MPGPKASTLDFPLVFFTEHSTDFCVVFLGELSSSAWMNLTRHDRLALRISCTCTAGADRISLHTERAGIQCVWYPSQWASALCRSTRAHLWGTHALLPSGSLLSSPLFVPSLFHPSQISSHWTTQGLLPDTRLQDQECGGVQKALTER